MGKGRPIGLPKTGGRKAGVKNKDKRALEERALELGCDPFQVLCEFCGPDQPDDRRFAAAKELAQYLYPKKKALEVKAEHDVGIRVIVEDYGAKDSTPAKTEALPKDD